MALQRLLLPGWKCHSNWKALSPVQEWGCSREQSCIGSRRPLPRWRVAKVTSFGCALWICRTISFPCSEAWFCLRPWDMTHIELKTASTWILDIFVEAQETVFWFTPGFLFSEALNSGAGDTGVWGPRGSSWLRRAFFLSSCHLGRQSLSRVAGAFWKEESILIA